MIEPSVAERVGRAVILDLTTAPDRVAEDRYFVTSTATPVNGVREVYAVDLDAEDCTCPDSGKGFTCKHVYWATIHQARVNSR